MLLLLDFARLQMYTVSKDVTNRSQMVYQYMQKLEIG
jgi:hypothetical protein